MPEPLTLKEEFPTTEGICPDCFSLAVISPAYASSTGELNAILQYFYHFFNFDKYTQQKLHTAYMRISA